MKMRNSEQPADQNDIGLATSTEPRCACLILADCSGSMDGQPIIELNAGLQQLKTKSLEDPLACLRVELALVTFNSDVAVAVDFCSPDNFNPPPLTASGETRLGEALTKGVEMLAARCAQYRAAGNGCFRPWLVVITDGKPTDDIAKAAQMVNEAESKKRLSYFGIGVQGADMSRLASISLRPPLHLDGLKFTELFEWLSVGLSSVSASQLGEQVPLPAPNWATV
jgi:uncharacterized protein YegL